MSRRWCCRCSSRKAYLPVHWDGLFGAFKAGPSAAVRRRRSSSIARRDAGVRRDHAGAIHGQVAARSRREFALWTTRRSSGSWGSTDARGISRTRQDGRRHGGRLLAAGHSLAVYNRTAARAAPFAKLGARIAESPQRRRAEGRRHHRHDGGRRIVARHVAGRTGRAGGRQCAARALPSSVRRCRTTGCSNSRTRCASGNFATWMRLSPACPMRPRRGTSDAAGRRGCRRSRRRAPDLRVARHARAALRRRGPGHRRTS